MPFKLLQMWPEIILTSSGESFFGKIYSAKSFCLHEKYCAEVLSQGTTMMQRPMPAPLRNLRREWTNMSVFVLDGELWDSQKSDAVLHKCFSHSSSLPVTSSPWPTAAVNCCPCSGWSRTQRCEVLCISLQLSPSQKLSVSIPTFPPCSDIDNPCRSRLVIPAPRVGALLDSGPRDINT